MKSDAAASTVHRLLSGYVRRRRSAAVTRSLGWAVSLGIGWSLLACLTDRLLPMPAAARAVLLAIAVIGPGVMVVGPLAMLVRRRFDPVAAATAAEKQCPAFAHRLVTVASAGEATALRAALGREVADLIAATGPAHVPRRPVATAWATAGLAIVIAAGLWRWPWLDLRQLARRLLHPTASIAAVTTTHLTVRPGAAAVVEGRPLTINATATRLPANDGINLHVSEDGQTWTERPLSPAGDDSVATLPDVDRDLRYFVTAGDAVSPTYAVRVLRVPAVVMFRWRLEFPPDLRRPPATVANSDGVINAPAGTAVTVDVVATVPLRSGMLSVGPERFETTATADPCVCRARLVVQRDERINVWLTSADGISGGGPRSARVRVAPSGDAGDVLGFEGQQRAYRDAMTTAAAHR